MHSTAENEPSQTETRSAAPAAGSEVKLEESWKRELLDEFSKPYMQGLRQFLKDEIEAGKRVYPPPKDIFNAFNHTPFDRVKVVILGQDPYHGPQQAHGLSFSVPIGVDLPPSLRNIFKELHQDLGVAMPNHGFLRSWADQGVLMLNAVLSVRQREPASHQGRGWETFTDQAIHALNEKRDHLVFMLWGAYAQKKGEFIDRSRHLVLMAPHPSPFSAARGFFGCRHFSQANRYLVEHGKPAVEWQLPDVQVV